MCIRDRVVVVVIVVVVVVVVVVVASVVVALVVALVVVVTVAEVVVAVVLVVVVLQTPAPLSPQPSGVAVADTLVGFRTSLLKLTRIVASLVVADAAVVGCTPRLKQL